MKYPIEKYKFYFHAREDGAVEVIAVSSYAGHQVKGRAICHPEDPFDIDFGKELAALRCAKKIAQKRYKRAVKCVVDSVNEYNAAYKRKNEMEKYLDDATTELIKTSSELTNLLEKV